MTFKEKIEALKSKLKAKIKSESTPEEIQEINDLMAELDSLDSDFSSLSDEHSKVKDALVRITVSQGSGEAPKDESGGSKPMTIDEVLAEVEKGGK